MSNAHMPPPANLSEIWAKIVEKCWKDESYKKRVIANPVVALKEAGHKPSPSIKYIVIEEKDSELKSYLSLPKKPDSKEMSDDALKNIAGGQRCGGGGGHV